MPRAHSLSHIATLICLLTAFFCCDREVQEEKEKNLTFEQKLVAQWTTVAKDGECVTVQTLDFSEEHRLAFMDERTGPESDCGEGYDNLTCGDYEVVEQTITITWDEGGGKTIFEAQLEEGDDELTLAGERSTLVFTRSGLSDPLNAGCQ